MSWKAHFNTFFKNFGILNNTPVTRCKYYTSYSVTNLGSILYLMKNTLFSVRCSIHFLTLYTHNIVEKEIIINKRKFYNYLFI